MGSRSARGAAGRGGNVQVDGRARPKSYRLEGGEEVDVELPPEPRGDRAEASSSRRLRGRAPARRGQAGGRRRPPGRGPCDRHARARARGPSAGRRRGPARDRPPARPRHVGAAGRRAHGRGVSSASASSSRRARSSASYLALVRGHPRSRRGRIDAPIGRDRDEPTRRSLDTDAPREAVTHFEVLELLGATPSCDVKLETGRTHQIRVHLAAIDLPVVGDPVYGVPDKALGTAVPARNAARLRASGHRRADRRRIAAPGRSRRYLGRLRGTG